MVRSNTGATRGKDGRFAKGKSGNPDGRPKSDGSRAQSEFASVFERKISATRGGEATGLSVMDAARFAILKEAMKGKAGQIRKVTSWIIERETSLKKEADRLGKTGAKLTFSSDPENANEALKLLGIAAVDPYYADLAPEHIRHKLEPWAVKQALSRRRGRSSMTAKEVQTVKSLTCDAESICWPKGVDE